MIGARIRALRRQQGLTLRDLSDRTGLTESFLSQVERGRTGASVASLRKIAEGLGATVAELFDRRSGDRARVLRRDQRPVMSHPWLGFRSYLLTPDPDGRLEIIWSTIEPGGGMGDELYGHGQGEEVFIVLSGQMEVQIGDERYELMAGDSLTYDSQTPHGWRNSGMEPAEVLWVMTPPSY